MSTLDPAGLITVGDSISSAVVAETNSNEGGWPEMLGIPPANRLAVRGTTAQQWAGDDMQASLAAAVQSAASAAVISLMANDFRAVADKGIMAAFDIMLAIQSMRSVVAALEGKRLIVLLYADPYFGRDAQMAAGAVLLNDAVRMACAGVDVRFVDLGTFLTAEDYDGVDIHPMRPGHRKIAEKIRAAM